MDIGDLVICIDNKFNLKKNTDSLTKGKVYKILEADTVGIIIVNEHSIQRRYVRSRFFNLNNHRSNVIDEILE